MKKNINVLIIDDNESFIKDIENNFSSHAVINVVKTFQDSKKGLEYIINNSTSFDLLLLDIIMPEVDGITILDEMKNKNISKKIIVLSSYKTEKTLKLISQYNVDYYMPKPINNKILEKRIMGIESDIIEKKVDVKENKIEIEISKMLHDLGIPSHIRGYQYIRDGVYILFKSQDKIVGITKSIYPKIAKKYDTTASRVERAIRHAIEVSWSRGDYDLMEHIFGHSVDYDRSKPTNSEFIATIADNIRLKNSLAI